MKTNRVIPILFCFLALISVFLFASEPVRTWRTKSGSEIEAVWDTSSDTGGEEIRLLKDGKKFRVRIDKLSEEDFNYVQDRRAELAEGDSGDFVPEEEEETPSEGSSRGTSEASSSPGDNSEIRPERSVTAKANKKYAVLVGVNEYEKLRGLRYAASDVNLIRDQLLELGFEPENIFTLTSGSGVANAPVKRIIEERIGHVLDEAGQNDMIFLAFAGHGVQIDKTVYFCPQDTQEEIVNSALSITDLIKRLESSPARFKWMVIDACRENPFKSRNVNSNARSIQKLDDPPRGLVILQSCANTELSYEDEELEHGLFSYNLVEGLKGAAADDEGKLTLMDVCKYTTDQTVKMSVQKFGQYQRPYMMGELSDFIIADNLKRDGLSREVWNEADGYYRQACLFRRQRQYSEAQEEIRKALKLTENATEGSEERQRYLDESEDIGQRLETETKLAEAEQARQEAELARLQAEEDSRRARMTTSFQLAQHKQTVSADTQTVRVSRLGEGTSAGEKQKLSVNGIDYTFCWCPPGEFEMGSPETEEGRADDEKQHRVRLTKGFWLLESEVTQEMWLSVMGPSKESDLKDDAGRGPRYPMYFVDWEECQEFCRTLSDLTGEQVQLPTEAQWEYACRAGTSGPYGNTGRLDGMGWYYANSGMKTHEVNGKKPNAWGLYDMHGNVWEWCSDWYAKNYYDISPESDPTGPDTGSNRVCRGGSWFYGAEHCRSARRLIYDSTIQRNFFLGFRPVVVHLDTHGSDQADAPTVEPEQSRQEAEEEARKLPEILGSRTETTEPVRLRWNILDDQDNTEIVEAKEWTLSYTDGKAKFILVLMDGSEKEYPVESLCDKDDLEFLCRFIIGKLTELDTRDKAHMSNIKVIANRLDEITAKSDRKQAEAELKALFLEINDMLCSVSLELSR